MATTQSIIPLKDVPMGQVALERFMRMVKRPVDGEDGCWLWQGAKSKKTGHGRFRLDGKLISPHRLAYQQFVGSIPEKHYVCHRCDNGACVNPAHLFAGTNSDNMRDCVAKGRMTTMSPEWKENRRLMNSQYIDTVKELLLERLSLSTIARRLGFHPAIVQDFCQRYQIPHHGKHAKRERRTA